MARRPVLEFWYEFASTYSYLAAMRIESLAAEAGVGRALAAVPARPDLRRPGLDHFAVQPLSRPRAATCGATWSARRRGSGCPATGPIRFRRTASRRPGRALRGGQGWTPAFTQAVYTPGIRRGPQHRRADVDRRDPRPASASTGRQSSRRPRASRTRRASRRSARKPSPAASSARRPSSPRTARCSGATTASNRPSPGRPASEPRRRRSRSDPAKAARLELPRPAAFANAWSGTALCSHGLRSD